MATRSQFAAGMIVFLFLLVGVCAADQPSEDIWLISTRRSSLLRPAGKNADHLTYWQLGADNSWQPADLEALLDSDDPAVPTTVFVHGNYTDSQQAVQIGWTAFNRLNCRAAGRPFRFVIWSWPTDRMRGILKDLRIKGSRSDVQSYYLAGWLDRLDPDVPVSLVGHSFGARVVTGALEILGGGQVAGRTLPSDRLPVERGPVRAVLLAGAFDNDWLLPRRRYGSALSQVERLLVTRNDRDPVLKFYPLLSRPRGPGAMGYTGPACPARLGQEREKIEIVNVECSVGRSHSSQSYLDSGTVISQLARYSFPELPKPETAVRGPTLPDVDEP